ncbi:hypothetical protein [Streptomyces sp. NPDC001089]
MSRQVTLDHALWTKPLPFGACKPGRNLDRICAKIRLISTRTRWGNMRGVGAAAIVCMTVVALTACNGTDGGAAHAKPEDSGSRTVPARSVLKVATVRATIRAAASAAALGRPQFTNPTTKLSVGSSCWVTAVINTGAKPDRKTFDAFVTAFKDRGWKATDEMPDTSGVGLAVDKDGWSLVVLAGALSKEQVAAENPGLPPDQVHAFRGVSVAGSGTCGAPTPTP